MSAIATLPPFNMIELNSRVIEAGFRPLPSLTSQEIEEIKKEPVSPLWNFYKEPHDPFNCKEIQRVVLWLDAHCSRKCYAKFFTCVDARSCDDPACPILPMYHASSRSFDVIVRVDNSDCPSHLHTLEELVSRVSYCFFSRSVPKFVEISSYLGKLGYGHFDVVPSDSWSGGPWNCGVHSYQLKLNLFSTFRPAQLMIPGKDLPMSISFGTFPLSPQEIEAGFRPLPTLTLSELDTTFKLLHQIDTVWKDRYCPRQNPVCWKWQCKDCTTPALYHERFDHLRYFSCEQIQKIALVMHRYSQKFFFDIQAKPCSDPACPILPIPETPSQRFRVFIKIDLIDMPPLGSLGRTWKPDRASYCFFPMPEVAYPTTHAFFGAYEVLERDYGTEVASYIEERGYIRHPSPHGIQWSADMNAFARIPNRFTGMEFTF